MSTLFKSNLPKLKSIGIVSIILLFALVSLPGRAQQTTMDGTQVYGDYSALRTNTWSVYLQGGTTWAHGVWYQNDAARLSYCVAPALGGGIDYNILPWVRVGADYLYSGYRREQRPSSLDVSADPVFAYGNYAVRYHKVKIGSEFNIMEIFPKRRAQWLNIYAGTGAGYMMASGNEYNIFFSTTQTQGGVTKPLTNNISVDNNSPLVISSNVRTINTPSAFNNFYIPATLSVEADINPRWTVGAKGEYDYVINRKEISPKGVIAALVTLRYNFVPGKAQMMRKRCKDKQDELNGRLQDAIAKAEAERQYAEDAIAEQNRLREENEALQKGLEECKNCLDAAKEEEKMIHYVQFDHNSSFFNFEEADKLKAFAASAAGKTLNLVAEASTPGEAAYNQALSERRLNRVMEALLKIGIPRNKIQPAVAIGESRGIETAEGRRVTIIAE